MICRLTCGKYTGTILYEYDNNNKFNVIEHNSSKNWTSTIIIYINEILQDSHIIYKDFIFKTDISLEEIINSLKSNDPEIVKMMLCILINNKI